MVALAAERHVTLQWLASRRSFITSRARLRGAVLSLPMMRSWRRSYAGALARSWRAALAGVWVNVLPVLTLVALAGLCRWPLGCLRACGAISIGVAIDDTLHSLRSYQRRGR